MQSRAPFGVLAGTLALALFASAGCAPSSQPKPSPSAEVTSAPAKVDAAAAPLAVKEDASSPPVSTSASASASSAPSSPASASASSAPVKVKVKIVTIGMHVAGGPFDEPTKEPFKKAVEPHFPEIAQCWGKHITKPPKQADVGVDLLIEASGGHPKISNPRLTPAIPEAEGFMPCVIGVFESVEFAKLADRGRTGVSYSLRFTSKE